MVQCRPLTEDRAAGNATALRLEGHLTRADRERSPYAYLPFDVPAGVLALRVSFDHEPPGDADDPGRGAVLDLGLFGPGSLEPGTPAFRGWSGSERRTVVIGPQGATPGYRPGAIEPGRWHAIVGLYAIPDDGCTYRLGVEFLDRAPTDGMTGPGRRRRTPATAPAALRAPAARGRGPVWLACDLHAHSVHSDGADDLETVALLARRGGLDVLFVTDHNTDSHLPHLAAAGRSADLITLPGEEVTTYRGHLNALGIRDWVDFRHRRSDDVRDAIAGIHAQGGLASINHPTSDGSPWRFADDLPIDLVEVWNGPWRADNQAALDWWIGLLAAGRRPGAVGGSDMHSAAPADQPAGTPVTWVRTAAPTLAGVLDGLRARRVILTRDARVPRPELRARSARGPDVAIGGALPRGRAPVELAWSAAGSGGERLSLRGAGGTLVDVRLAPGPNSGRLTLTPEVAAAARWVHLEIRDAADDLAALTNPIFLEGAS
jgi:hypothetical protein